MKRGFVIALAGASLVLAACSTGATPSDGASGGTDSSPPGSSVIDLKVPRTTGPNGEEPTPVTDLTLTNEEIAKLRAGKYSAAMLWNTSSAFVSAVQSGAQAEFDRLGIKVSSTAGANFDAGLQANQIQSAMAKKPSVILSTPVDSTSAAAPFRPAVDAGTKLVFLSNVPDGYTRGKEYASIVTDDLYQMGNQAAVALGEAMHGKGKVGVLFYDAKYYVTNQRDAVFKQTLETKYPDIEVVAQQGFTDPNTAEGIASAMLTQHPDLGGIYTSWAGPAAGVLSALRSTSNTTTKVVTLDLDDQIVVDMATGGQTIAVVADKAWELGKGMADAAAYALLGKEPPAFAVAGVLTISKDNVPQGYRDSLHADVPDAVRKVLK
ncbi:substrate-binding domain-containing protein [Micromonospora sp. NPDC005305]|uniref:substrate-binding domain-containing protein n=1 Tax=Micromonospora sp. NPDC005305 TaxID=3156875 RepID=UPI0033A1D2C8